MFSPQLGKLVKIWLVTLATLALTAGSPSAAVLLNFNELPNEGGIHLTGTEPMALRLMLPWLVRRSFAFRHPAASTSQDVTRISQRTK